MGRVVIFGILASIVFFFLSLFVSFFLVLAKIAIVISGIAFLIWIGMHLFGG